MQASLPSLPTATPELINAIASAVRGNPEQAVSLFNHLPQLNNLAKEGKLNEVQLGQLKVLFAVVAQQQKQAILAGAQQGPARQASLAGMKRKSPEPDTLTLGPNPAAATGASTGGNPAAIGTVPFLASDSLKTADPGPQPWPGAVPQRPTLSGGLAHGVIVGTPAFVQRPPGDYDLFTSESPRHGVRKNSNADHNMRRTIQDLVTSIDPNVKVDREVEDLLLDLADEFIDSVANFSCRLAKHRGAEALEVRDLQLHLERNHNIRIPGFSDMHNVIQPAPLKAETDSKTGGSTPASGSKKSAAASGPSKRSLRLAAIANEKKVQKLL